MKLALKQTALQIAGGLMITAGLVELGIRQLHPRPKVQIVREDPDMRKGIHRLTTRRIEDTLVWSTAYARPRHNPDCLQENGGEVRKVLVLGSSIFAGVSLDNEQVFSAALQEALSTEEPTCVFNLAEPAFSYDAQMALAKEFIAKVEPDVIVWEIWENLPLTYSSVEDTAYRFKKLETGPDGTPNPMFLPLALHRWLLPRSRAYEYAVITFATPKPLDSPRQIWADFATSGLPEIGALASQTGAELLFVYCPRLDIPFAEQMRWRRNGLSADKHFGYDLVSRFAQTIGASEVYLAESLGRDDLQEIRLDPCCHYNAKGQKRLAEVLEAPLRGLLAHPEDETREVLPPEMR